MPWFKVDDTLPFNTKVVAAGNSAMGLWVRAGAWSMQQLTEGFIPAQIALTLGSRKDAHRLVTVVLWTEEHGGYRFWQWDKDGRQPTKAQVETDRHAARERQRKARQRAKAERESRRDTSVTNGVTPLIVTVPPTRPDPTRPDPTLRTELALGGERPETFHATESTARAKCSKHPDGDTGEACPGCARVREREDKAAERDGVAEAERRRKERENCPTCEGMGLVLDESKQPTKRKCHHLRRTG